MTTFKGLQAASLASLLALGIGSVAACSDDPSDPAVIDAGADATPTADGGTSDADAGDPCAFGEPNDTRETAKAIDLNKSYTGLCVSNPDSTSTSGDGEDELDFFEITAPTTDNAGGYVELSLSNVSSSGLGDFIVTSEADNQVIVENYTTDLGGSVKGWFTVSPGAKYRIQVNRFGGHGDRFSYDLLAKYTAIADTYEPNNTKETAKPITLTTPITASAAAHSANTPLTEDDQKDYYSITLAAGTATVSMTNVPALLYCDVQLYDAGGTKVNEVYNTTAGGDCKLDLVDLVGGSYLVLVSPFNGIIRGGNDTPPAYVTGQYTLAVTQ